MAVPKRKTSKARRDKYYSKDCPARAAFAVKGLPMGALVEIETIAINHTYVYNTLDKLCK